mmetsp:Transcript_84401/g.214864  ORF Transcript_84401/g.214864 Transcript_84401/m.214864 type:complete len:238 (+) Transcript_84401:30-743(+)
MRPMGTGISRRNTSLGLAASSETGWGCARPMLPSPSVSACCAQRRDKDFATAGPGGGSADICGAGLTLPVAGLRPRPAICGGPRGAAPATRTSASTHKTGGGNSAGSLGHHGKALNPRSRLRAPACPCPCRPCRCGGPCCDSGDRRARGCRGSRCSRSARGLTGGACGRCCASGGAPRFGCAGRVRHGLGFRRRRGPCSRCGRGHACCRHCDPGPRPSLHSSRSPPRPLPRPPPRPA